MRIAYVTETYPPELNGVALTVERTVRHLREAGHEVALVRPRQPLERAQCDGTEWRTSGLPIPMYADLRFGLATQGRVRRYLERLRPDVVHVATPGPLGWASIAAASDMGLGLTSDFRTNFHQYSRYYGLGALEPLVRRYLKVMHNRSHRTFVPTPALARELAAHGFERLEVLGRGVDVKRFNPLHRCEALRREWGATDEAPVLLYVGRLAAEKNVPLALQAFRVVRSRQPMARMVVVGDGPLRERLQRLYPEVHFAGVRHGQDLARHYASADLFVFPSLSETFGNVTLEALASGLATVAFNTAAAAEHIVNGVSGRLVPVDEPKSFVAMVCALAGVHRHLDGVRARARQQAVKADWHSVLNRFENHLQDTAYVAQTARDAGTCLA